MITDLKLLQNSGVIECGPVPKRAMQISATVEYHWLCMSWSTAINYVQNSYFITIYTCMGRWKVTDGGI